MALNVIDKFIWWYNEEFKTTDLWYEMTQCIEGSPWHRERNVAAHTDMVVQHAVSKVNPTSVLNSGLLPLFAAAFHDVGKPQCEVTKHSEARGDYHSYGGHELVSARLWEDFYATHSDYFEKEFGINPFEAFKIGTLIENHKPWEIKKDEKLNNMAETIAQLQLMSDFDTLLNADQRGRMSDDWDKNQRNTEKWIESFRSRWAKIVSSTEVEKPDFTYSPPPLIVPIGASGSGKSTYRNLVVHEDTLAYSLDDLRLEFYGEPYSQAFIESTKDKKFKQKTNARFMEMVKEGKGIYLDNTNTSRKNRRFFITEARKKGYKIIAILFPVSLRVVIDRQNTREDKAVPEEAVRRQYLNLQLPQFGEFDQIIIRDSNLK